jgi:hypothetical protein
VVAVDGGDHVRELSGLEQERRGVERRDHLAAAEEAEVAALGGSAVRAELARQRLEALPAADALEEPVGEDARAVALAGVASAPAAIRMWRALTRASGASCAKRARTASSVSAVSTLITESRSAEIISTSVCCATIGASSICESVLSSAAAVASSV